MPVTLTASTLIRPNVPLKVPFNFEFEFELMVMSQVKLEYCFPEMVRPMLPLVADGEEPTNVELVARKIFVVPLVP